MVHPEDTAKNTTSVKGTCESDKMNTETDISSCIRYEHQTKPVTASIE